MVMPTPSMRGVMLSLALRSMMHSRGSTRFRSVNRKRTNQAAFLMWRLRKARAEFSPTALAYKLRRVLNIVEFPRLMAAVLG